MGKNHIQFFAQNILKKKWRSRAGNKWLDLKGKSSFAKKTLSTMGVWFFRKQLSTMSVVVPGFIVGYSGVVSPPVFQDLILLLLEILSNTMYSEANSNTACREALAPW